MPVKIKKIMFWTCCATTMSFLLAASFAAAQVPDLTVDMCIICHTSEATNVEANGAKHKTSVSCLDCHEGHPPSVKDNIPQCSNCHDGEPHFELEGCLTCHTDPHTPLNITLEGELTTPCLTCHTEQIAQLNEHPSHHSTMACTSCHSEKHGRIPECMECHSPHTNDMTMNDCVSCHKVHMPLVVTYPEDIPSKACAACHEDIYTLLMANMSKHSELSCATCHHAVHKMIPSCHDCHGTPHPPGLMNKFPACADCHEDPHKLVK